MRLLTLTGLLGAPAAPALAQGYSYLLSPLAHAEGAWLLMHAQERSDPNTAAETRMLPSLRWQREAWLIVDGNGRQMCQVRTVGTDPAVAALRAPDGGAVRVQLLTRVRRRCGRVMRTMPQWLDAEPIPALRWWPDRVCIGDRCVVASAVQRSRNGVASVGVVGAAPARARCVADRWLIVANTLVEDGSSLVEGARFPGLPPPVRDDIVGYETVYIDGVTRLPAELRCP